MTEVEIVKAFLKDLLVRAAHTFWQAASAAAITLWAASGLSVTDLLDISTWDKIWSTVVMGALGAGLSATKTVLVNAIGGSTTPEDSSGNSDEPAPAPVASIAPVVAPAITVTKSSPATSAGNLTVSVPVSAQPVDPYVVPVFEDPTPLLAEPAVAPPAPVAGPSAVEQAQAALVAAQEALATAQRNAS